LAGEAAGRSAWTGFVAAAAVSAALLAALGLAVTCTIDPYWIFRAEPPWLRWTGGVNRHLDIEMRRAKPLQLFERPASTVLIGSSVVYRGIRPSDVAGGPAFNLGLSAMNAAELPVAAGLAAGRDGVRRVVIGLDYFMFSASAVRPHSRRASSGGPGGQPPGSEPPSAGAPSPDRVRAPSRTRRNRAYGARTGSSGRPTTRPP
jgi:hypothetical protein